MITFLSSQVEEFSEEVHPHVENASEKLGLHDPFWAPLLMDGLAISHFLISAILVVAYWNLKVRVCRPRINLFLCSLEVGLEGSCNGLLQIDSL